MEAQTLRELIPPSLGQQEPGPERPLLCPGAWFDPQGKKGEEQRKQKRIH